MTEQVTTGKVIEEWVTSNDGVPIYTKTWKVNA